MSPRAGFQIGCVTKLLTSLAALDLVCQGRIGLDVPIAEYLPELGDLAALSDVRVRDLGSHTSGYRGLSPGTPQFGYFYSWAKFLEFLKTTRQMFVPGTTFNYEHTESVILGAIVHRVSGRSVEEIVRGKIFAPLHLEVGASAGAGRGPETLVTDHSMDPAGGQYRTVKAVPFCGFWAASLSNWTAGTEDLVVLADLMAEGVSDSELPASAIRLARDQLVRLPMVAGGRRREQIPVTFGFGCAEYAGSLFGHNGSGRGQTCGVRFDANRKIAVVVALNAWLPYVRDHLLREIGALLGTPLAQPAGVPQTVDVESEEFEGVYTGCVSGAQVRVIRSGGELNCDLCDVSGAVQARMILIPDGRGGLAMKSDAQHLSVGFFREKAVGAPCLMLGLNAFRKDGKE